MMELVTLMAISPLDGRYQQKLSKLQSIFSEFGLIRFRAEVEIKWLLALVDAKLTPIKKLSDEARKYLKAIITDFSSEDALRVKSIESITNHDVKAVEYLIKEKIIHHKELQVLTEFIHFGCTSEDINNLAYGLMLNAARQQLLIPNLDQLILKLIELAHQYADIPMLSRTHGQAATPTTLGKEIANVVARLRRQLLQLTDAVLLGKLNGATGNFNAFCVAKPEINWQQLSEQFINNLGLNFNPYTTQIEPHDSLAEFFAILVRINTILIDFNRDTWNYIAINYFKQKTLSGEVGSSTMPHKVNPIDFENAEGNLGIANALLQHMIVKLPISRWQRDLSDSTVLRNIGVAISHAYLAYQATLKGLTKIEANNVAIEKDLSEHWEVLAEPIQTVMRTHGIDKSYETLKNLTRGKKVDQSLLHQFIMSLPLPQTDKDRLLELTPAKYIGYANKLAKDI